MKKEDGRLVMGVDAFTLLDLLKKAAAYKGVELWEKASRAISKPFKTYALTKAHLDMLQQRNIVGHERPDCRYELYTLVDKNPQDNVPGWAPSNYWNFKRVGDEKSPFDMSLQLCVGFSLNLEQRGFVLVPQTYATMLSPCDHKPNFRMFKALADNDPKAPAIAKAIAASENGSITVSWTDLGLGGLRRLRDVFAEFAGDRGNVSLLATHDSIFSPAPYPQNADPGDELFLAEPAQPRVIAAWRQQLGDYCNSLVA